MPAQQRVAEGMKRGDLDVGIAIGHQLVDARLHLGGGLIREREGEDLFGPRLALVDEVGDTPGNDGGLAGPGARDDEERPGVVGNGLTLRVVEAIEDPTAHALRL